MSKIVMSAIFLQKFCSDDEASKIDELLNQLSDEVKSTRKCRFWEVTKDNRLYNIDVRATIEKLYDVEDELLNLNMLPEDAPETILIVSFLGGKEDFKFVSSVTEKISAVLNGVSSGAKYSS